MSPRPAKRGQRGFTLIEVMIALTIAALGLSAVITTVSRSIDNSNRFRNQTLATYIGLNVITEIRLSGEFPKVRETSDDVEYAGRNWVWVARVTETDVEALRRIDVDVAFADAPDQRIHTVTGFAGQPVSGNSANSVWSGLRGETE